MTDRRCAYDDAPLRPFHLRVAVASFGGVFSDGFGLGIIGIALAGAAPHLHLTPLWLGLLGGASLAGLFLGALLTGPCADRFGRRPVFAYNMLLLALCAGAQFFIESAAQLLALRLVIGFLLGTDYVVSKALLTEFTPRAFRGRVMSTLSVAWAGGYTCAYFIGYLLSDIGPDAWRWMLACSALPCLLILPLRLTLPESPLWLAAHGRNTEAAKVVAAGSVHSLRPGRTSEGFVVTGVGRSSSRRQWRRRTLVGCIFFTCQVIPYFAVGTFVTRVLDALQVRDSFVGGLAYNLSLLMGAVLGLLSSIGCNVAFFDRQLRGHGAGDAAADRAAAAVAHSRSLRCSPCSQACCRLRRISATCTCRSCSPPICEPPGSGLRSPRAASARRPARSCCPLWSASTVSMQPSPPASPYLLFGGIACYAWAPETRNCSLDATVPPS